MLWLHFFRVIREEGDWRQILWMPICSTHSLKVSERINPGWTAKKKIPDDPFQTVAVAFLKKCPKQTKYGVFYQFNLGLYILKQLKTHRMSMWSCNSVGRRLQVLHLQQDLVGNQKLLATPLCYIVEMHIMHICQIWQSVRNLPKQNNFCCTFFPLCLAAKFDSHVSSFPGPRSLQVFDLIRNVDDELQSCSIDERTLF